MKSLVSKISFGVALLMLLFVNEAFSSEAKTTEEYEAEIEAIIQHVKDNNAFTDSFDETTPQNMPVGIKKTVGSMDMLIVFDKAVCTSEKATMEAYMAFEFPGSGKNVIFKGTDIQFYAGGLLNATLQLVSTKPVKIGNMEIELDPQKTYVTFDCNGYKETALSAILKLPQNVFKKEDPTTRQVIDGQSVTASITGTFENLNDIMIEASLDPFQISGLSGFGFYASSIFVDLSDEHNPAFKQTTYNYVKKEFQDEELWRGVYISTFDVKLPKDFCKDGKSPSIGASDMLIDDNGFTGTINAKDLLTLDTGDLGGWQFSMTSLGITMSGGHFDAFSFAGQLVLPVSQTPSPMGYEAHIGVNGYEFTITPPESTNFDIWAATIKLRDDSEISVSTDKETGKYHICADLNGNMDINAGSSKVSVAGVIFEHMVIQNTAPKFDINSFSATIGNMKGFPISVSNLGYEKNDKQHGLNLTVSVTLMGQDGEDKNGFCADGSFTIFGKEDEDKGITSWSYDRIEFKSFDLAVKYAAFEMNGSLVVYKNDPVYGDGMKGDITLTIIEKIEVSATAQFGNVDDENGNNYKYWYADAFVTFPSGIPIFTAVTMNGFGGGAYYHMKHVHNPAIVIDPKNPTAVNSDNETPGISPSGDSYVPDVKTGIGLKAAILLAIASEDVLNVKAEFEIAFTSSGSLSQVSFTGEALLLTKYSPTVKPSDAKMYCKLFMNYDVTNNSFASTLDTYLNFEGIMHGSNTDISGGKNYAGQGGFFIENGKWLLYMGHPTQGRIGINFFNIADANSYFVMGNLNVPPIPDIDSDAASILNSGNFSFCRNLGDMSTGKGFSFGASLKVSIPNKSFLCFYGSFKAGMGFDLMLTNTTKKCVGSNDYIGINGWYSVGQTWAYVQGDIGICCKLFKKKVNAHILEVGVATALQAKLPNPLYMTGEVGGHYSVFGGLIKGDCHFKFDIGNDCEYQNTSSDLLDGVEVISDLMPHNGASNVDVFATPQVTFNYAIDTEFKILNEQNNQYHRFRIKLDKFDVMNNGSKVAGEYKWNSDHNVLAFESYEVLPGNAKLEASVEVHFQELKNGAWVDVMDDKDNTVLAETRNVSFNTGDLPDYIPVSNIKNCYPLVNQTNYYQEEYATGFIELNRGQKYLFDKPDNERWSTEYRFSDGTIIKQNTFMYNSTTKKLEYAVPTDLKNETVYDVTIVNIPIAPDDNIEANVKTKISILDTGDTLITRATDGIVRVSSDEKVILTYQIRTSRYNTFKEKVNNLSYVKSESFVLSTAIHSMARCYSGTELFSAEEISGDSPMVRCSFVTDKNIWYNTFPGKYLYEDYPYGVYLTRRKDPLGIPPINCITVNQTNDNIRFTPGTMINWSSATNRFDCLIEYYIGQDYSDLKNKVINLPTSSITQRLADLANFLWTSMYGGKYYFNVSYYIPGEITPTSTEQLFIEY